MRNVFLLLILFSFSALGQNRDNKWAVTFGSGSVLYTPEDATALREVSAIEPGTSRYILLFPRFSVARYMSNNITLVASFSSNFESVQNYTTFDGELRYDFGTSENFITPYITVGGSVVKTLISLPTFNFGAGGTLWVSENFGLHGQFTYKYNQNKYLSQRPHLFGSAGLVYRFSTTGGNNNGTKRRGGNRKRIWDK